MSTKSDINEPTLRNDRFAEKITTGIWREEQDANNPYVAQRMFCHGYDLFELMRSCSYIEVLYLIFKGELPTKDEARFLETLMIALINPGPRHPATRAAMASANSKAHVSHILPISLSCLSGDHLGANEVEKAMRFIKSSIQAQPSTLIPLLMEKNPRPDEGDWHIAPGFGSRFGSIDLVPQKVADILARTREPSAAVQWGMRFASSISSMDLGWLSTGIAAAAFIDLGFHPRSGPGLFQILSSPGLLAHGLEVANKPITAMPFIDNEHYFFEPL